ncbi:MAG: glycosyltransferase family 2 protein [Myxococcales bacterium]|nr:glycosyltransferase family 2 protein [Myxococcales bacterium]
MRSELAALPMVSIVMPAFNEEAYIGACLRSIQAQQYPRDRIEVLIADGRSTDATRACIAAIAADDPRIVVIDNPERLQAPGLNRLLSHARGEVIVRMDVHCEYAPNYVSQCVAVLQATGADNVGGAQRPKAKTAFQEVLSSVLSSPLAVGGAKYRDASQEGFVDTVFLGAFRKDTLVAVGGYDPNAVTNEDAELNWRIRQNGGKIYLSRDIEVHYYPRDSFATLAKQYYRYGMGRARTMLKTKRIDAPRSVAPFAMLVGFAGLVAVRPLRSLALPAAAAYGAISLAEAIRVARKHGPGGVLQAWGMFPVLHFSHGAGFAMGLYHYAQHGDWQNAETAGAAPSDPAEDAALS